MSLKEHIQRQQSLEKGTIDKARIQRTVWAVNGIPAFQRENVGVPDRESWIAKKPEGTTRMASLSTVNVQPKEDLLQQARHDPGARKDLYLRKGGKSALLMQEYVSRHNATRPVARAPARPPIPDVPVDSQSAYRDYYLNNQKASAPQHLEERKPLLTRQQEFELPYGYARMLAESEARAERPEPRKRHPGLHQRPQESLWDPNRNHPVEFNPDVLRHAPKPSLRSTFEQDPEWMERRGWRPDALHVEPRDPERQGLSHQDPRTVPLPSGIPDARDGNVNLSAPRGHTVESRGRQQPGQDRPALGIFRNPSSVPTGQAINDRRAPEDVGAPAPFVNRTQNAVPKGTTLKDFHLANPTQGHVFFLEGHTEPDHRLSQGADRNLADQPNETGVYIDPARPHGLSARNPTISQRERSAEQTERPVLSERNDRAPLILGQSLAQRRAQQEAAGGPHSDLAGNASDVRIDIRDDRPDGPFPTATDLMSAWNQKGKERRVPESKTGNLTARVAVPLDTEQTADGPRIQRDIRKGIDRQYAEQDRAIIEDAMVEYRQRTGTRPRGVVQSPARQPLLTAGKPELHAVGLRPSEGKARPSSRPVTPSRGDSRDKNREEAELIRQKMDLPKPFG